MRRFNMAFQIENGVGNGYRAKVDSTFRLHTDAVSRSEREQAVLLGNCFNISTGPVTLTSANASAVFYMCYEGEVPFVIEEILVILGGTTGGAGDALIEILKNPSTGTIVSNAVAVNTNTNRDFSSSNVLSGSFYKGTEADTITNGDTFAKTTRNSFGTVVAFDGAPIVLRKGNSIAIKYTPPAGNTSQTCTVAMTALEEETEV